jgi:hypothetical protein
LHNKYPPYSLTVVSDPTPTAFAVFALAPAIFYDGPYLDPPAAQMPPIPNAASLQFSAVSGVADVVASSTIGINGGQGFLSTDVGRMLRVLSEPPTWNGNGNQGGGQHYYQLGDTVKWLNTYWLGYTLSGIVSEHNQPAGTKIFPDQVPGGNPVWVIDSAAANWTWCTINSVQSPTSITVTITPATADAAGNPRADGPLVNTTPVVTWQLGLWGQTLGYPAAGLYYEGRFWFTGQIPNRFDSTVSNQPQFCSLSAPDGTIANSNAISEVLNSTDKNTIYWLVGSHVGMVAGTQGGEWLIQASSLNEPLTPTSIQAHRVTKYGCANIEPRETGLNLVLVQRYSRKLLEYISDVYSGKFSATNISLISKHLTEPGIEEIAYQRELVPVVWARLANGGLIGCTYKRESPFGTQPAQFAAWHRHTLGSGRNVISIQSGPAVGGSLDTLALVTQDPVTGYCYFETLHNYIQTSDTVQNAWYVDAGIISTVAVPTDTGFLLQENGSLIILQQGGYLEKL